MCFGYESYRTQIPTNGYSVYVCSKSMLVHTIYGSGTWTRRSSSGTSERGPDSIIKRFSIPNPLWSAQSSKPGAVNAVPWLVSMASLLTSCLVEAGAHSTMVPDMVVNACQPCSLKLLTVDSNSRLRVGLLTIYSNGGVQTRWSCLHATVQNLPSKSLQREKT